MAKKKILVVDDTEFNRDLVVQLLEEDYDMVIAENGAEALTVSAKRTAGFDLDGSGHAGDGRLGSDPAAQG